MWAQLSKSIIKIIFGVILCGKISVVEVALKTKVSSKQEENPHFVKPILILMQTDANLLPHKNNFLFCSVYNLFFRKKI